MGDEISARCDAIEQCYEFMLAYAGQGLNGDEGSHSSGEVRDYLNRAVKALSGLAESFATAVKQQNLRPAEPYNAFLAVLNIDAHDSLAATQLVLSQTTIHPPFIHNLNTSI